MQRPNVTYPLTAQAAFDLALWGVRQQDYKPSMDPDGNKCQYRGAEGRKCAVGFMIPDEVYELSMDRCSYEYNGGAGALLHSYGSIRALFVPELHDAKLLKDLQSVHDNLPYPPAVCEGHEFFESRMREIAKNFDLTYTPVEA